MDTQDKQDIARQQAARRLADATAFMRMLWHPGDVREIRVIGPRGHGKQIDSGYFDSPEAAAKAAVQSDWQTKPNGLYVTLNPVREALLARAANRVAEWAKATTLDRHVTQRRWLLIDIDSVRDGDISDICATDAEVQATADVAEAVFDWLTEQCGWSEPAIIDSGNGRYCIFPIDRPNDDDSNELLRRVLHAVAGEFNSSAVDIDVKVANASRIMRAPGSKNRKGDDIPSRPHRFASVLSIPDYLRDGWCEPVSREKLEAVAAIGSEPVSEPTQSTTPHPPATGNVIDRARRYLEKIPPAVAGQEGHTATLIAAEHLVRGFSLSDDDALALLAEWNLSCEPAWTDGELRHKVKQAREQGKAVAVGHHLHPQGQPVGQHTEATRQPVLPSGTRVKALDRGNIGTVVEDLGASCVVHFDGQAGSADVTLVKTALAHPDGRPLNGSLGRDAVAMPEIVTPKMYVGKPACLNPILVDGLLRRGETANLIAASKVGKSWMVYGLAHSISTGQPWFGRFETKQGRVLIIDNELHRPTLEYRIEKVAASMFIQQSERDVSFLSLRGRLLDIESIGPLIASIEQGEYSLIIVDAWYRMFPPGVSENDNAAMAGLYNLSITHKSGHSS